MKYGNDAMESRLRGGIADVTPDRAEEIWNAPVEKSDGTEWYLDGVPGKHRGNAALRAVLAAAACLVLIITGLISRDNRVTTDVYLDVNPSVALRVNRRDQVVRVEALNADAEALVQSLGGEAKNRPIEEALDLLIDGMAEEGYLRADQNSVLLSVRSQSTDPDALCARLTRLVHDHVRRLVGSAAVFGQRLERDGEDTADDGRDVLIRRLAERLGVPESELRRATIEQLVQLLRDQNIDPEDVLDDVLDDDWDDPDDDDDDDFDDDDDDDDDRGASPSSAQTPKTPSGSSQTGSPSSDQNDDDDDSDDDADDDDDFDDADDD